MIITKDGKTNWKYLLILFFLAAIVSGGILLFDKMEKVQLQEIEMFKRGTTDLPSKNLMADDWKSFKSEEYKFELKYPKDWNDGPNLVRPSHPHRVFCPPEFSDLKSDFGCRWDIQLSGFKSSPAPIFFYIEDWKLLRGETKEEKKGTGWCQTQKKAKINGIDIELVTCDGLKRAYWEDPAGRHLYKLFLKNSDYSDEFNQILFNFKFLD